MLNLEEKLDIQIDEMRSELKLRFEAETDRAIYDICDYNGKILMTGPITEDSVHVDLSTLSKDRYILLILDGDRVFSQQFSLV